MRLVSPEKTVENTPAEQQQEQRAGTPEERAALLAKLAAEAALLKQHVLGMQPLVPLTAENSEPSMSRSQANFTISLCLYPLLKHFWDKMTSANNRPDWCDV